MSILERFYAGVFAQLQAEIDLINSLIPHAATKGSLNEESLRRVLSAFLGMRYGVGTGIVIDSFGKRSRQVDVVVFEKANAPSLFKTFSQVLFPVETVFACIEVKTAVNKASLEEITSENSSINGLAHYAKSISRLAASSSAPNTIELSELHTRPPMTYLVAYHTETDNPATVQRWFEESSKKELLPDLSLFLDLGMIVFRPKPSETIMFEYLLMPLRNTDIGEAKPGIVYAKEPATTLHINGHTYRSSRWKGKGGYPVIMPAKALLQFIIQLSRAVDAFPKHDFFDPTRYLAARSDEGIDVRQIE